jgi:hypothetical protein
MRHWTILLLAAIAATAARGQSFPFNDSFASYPAGSTGAPAWSILGGAFNAADGGLHAPVTLRYNGRPPALYALDATVSVTDETPDADGLIASAGVVFDMQHPGDTHASDSAVLTFRKDADGVHAEVLTRADTAAYPHLAPMKVAVNDPGRKDIPIRLVVDAGKGRFSFYVGGTAVVRSAPAEYAAGLLALRLDGNAVLDNLVLRTPTGDEIKTLQATTLFNDPRDIAGGEDGALLVLDRSSPAVLTVTPDGEVTGRFGRRLASGIPDAVAMARGLGGEVLVLNRFPGEVVAFDRNGGIRYRFGAGRLVEPSDLAVRANGTVYVADPGAGRLFVFEGGGRYLGEVSDFGGGTGAPSRVGVDALDNLVVSLDGFARSVVLRPALDNVSMALIQKSDDAPADIVVTPKGETWAIARGAVAAWPRTATDAPAFRGAAVAGLEPDAHLARTGERVALLERRNARVVFLPADLKDVKPIVAMQNVSDTAAIVRWESAEASKISRVRVLRGSTWDTVTDRAAEPATQHQVLLERLIPGNKYKYRLSPTVATIPPADWSDAFEFTAGENKTGPVKGQAP